MKLRLEKSEKSDLEEIARHQCGEVRLYRRARMVLLAADGNSISAVARKLGTARCRVREWLCRYQEHGIEGLGDLPRNGRPPTITSLERHQVIAIACRSPKEYGFQRVLWSHATLVSAVVSTGHVRSISPRTVGRILEDAEIKPHRVKMWCHSNDPAYQEKMRSIVELYVNPPKGEPVLCIDEKTGMQALSRSRSMQRSKAGRSARFEFEYRRNGTRCLFGCFNVGTGRVLGRCTEKRKREDFFSFMEQVASVYPQPRIHVVLDNLNTHKDTTKGAFITEWSKRHGNRFVFHYTPTHGSWLNQIELWFGIVSRRILRYGDFHSPEELIEAIEAFIKEWNETEAHPFRWSYEGLPLTS